MQKIYEKGNFSFESKISTNKSDNFLTKIELSAIISA